MRNTVVYLTALFICFCFIQCTNIDEPPNDIWAASLDSLEKYNPPPYLAEICSIGKSAQRLTNSDIKWRMLVCDLYEQPNFSLGIYIDSSENNDCYASYFPDINVIHIYNSGNTAMYGDLNKWASRAVLLSHELHHAIICLISRNYIDSLVNEHFAENGEKYMYEFVKNKVSEEYQGSYFEERH